MRDGTRNPGVGARGLHYSLKRPEEPLFDKMTLEDNEGVSQEVSREQRIPGRGKKKTGLWVEA